MPKKQTNIELNPAFVKALEIMEDSNSNVFITGRAGTGKSTLLGYFRDRTKKNIVVLAPTGVAAVNIKGQTIHSFFHFRPDITIQKVKKSGKGDPDKSSVYKKLDAIVIDEISMVRADLLDCVDAFMRYHGKNKNLPFGGAQMIFIGDLYQLPPVLTSQDKSAFLNKYKSPYFFASQVFSPQKKLLSDANEFVMETIELEKIYRQRDNAFIEILNAIRNNTATDSQIAVINARYDANCELTQEDFSIYLTTTNSMAAAINEKELAKLAGKLWQFFGKQTGAFDEKYLPTDERLEVKAGAQIMMLNNDRQGRWINGTIGKVARVTKEEDESVVWVELPDGEIEPVTPYTWDMYAFAFNTKSGHIESDVVGSFTQYPFKLAWAVTIHKAQGKTFDRVILDIGRGTFAPGQLYVALSRCTALEGLWLKKKISKQNVWMDWNVVKFMTGFQYDKSAEALPTADKVAMIQNAIDSEQTLHITYLKSSDIKSSRRIIPHSVGEMQYLGKTYLGVSAYCLAREEERVFRVDRILEMRVEGEVGD